MKLIDIMRESIAEKILPETSQRIGIKEKLGVMISKKPRYTFNFYTDGEPDTELSYCIPSPNGPKKYNYNTPHTGKHPKIGEKVELDVFLPGLTSGANYGTYPLEVKKIIKDSVITQVIVVGNQFYKEGKTFKSVPLD